MPLNIPEAAAPVDLRLAGPDSPCRFLSPRPAILPTFAPWSRTPVPLRRSSCRVHGTSETEIRNCAQLNSCTPPRFPPPPQTWKPSRHKASITGKSYLFRKHCVHRHAPRQEEALPSLPPPPAQRSRAMGLLSAPRTPCIAVVALALGSHAGAQPGRPLKGPASRTPSAAGTCPQRGPLLRAAVPLFFHPGP